MALKALFAIAIVLVSPSAAHATATATGANGAKLSISQSQFTKEMKVKVVGRSFDETVGIYLAYCVVPKKGLAPSPCGNARDWA